MPTEMNADFAGIVQKLERATQNIVNLKSEIDGFFDKCKYPILPKMNDERHLEAVEYHKALKIPIRFGVLSGEVIHHLRSCLDHIVWLFSDVAYRGSKEGRYIEFPVLESRPRKEHRHSQYTRKVKGIASLSVRKLIVRLQPYRTHPTDSRQSLIWVIHNMDVFDKHRALVITEGRGVALIPVNMPEIASEFQSYVSGARGPLPASLKRKLDEHCQVRPDVTFRDVDGWTSEPLIPFLYQLTNHVINIVLAFDKLY
jgi:hypothetical protein